MKKMILKLMFSFLFLFLFNYYFLNNSIMIPINLITILFVYFFDFAGIILLIIFKLYFL